MAASSNTEDRGQFGSSLGFIMAAAGSAVGLGNIWRFPYLTGENGGGAFVFVYILCVVLIGLPLLFNEIALGRKSGKNPIGAIRETGGNKFWQLAGVLCVLVCFFVFSYYASLYSAIILSLLDGQLGIFLRKSSIFLLISKSLSRLRCMLFH